MGLCRGQRQGTGGADWTLRGSSRGVRGREVIPFPGGQVRRPRERGGILVAAPGSGWHHTFRPGTERDVSVFANGFSSPDRRPVSALSAERVARFSAHVTLGRAPLDWRCSSSGAPLLLTAGIHSPQVGTRAPLLLTAGIHSPQVGTRDWYLTVERTEYTRMTQPRHLDVDSVKVRELSHERGRARVEARDSGRCEGQRG